MCPRSWRVIKFWPISIPISSRNFSQSTRSVRRKPVPDAFWLLPYLWRSRAQRGLAQFSKLLCAKGRCARDTRCHFSRRLFYHRQLDMGFCRRNELALSAVAGNSHSDSRTAASEGKTASPEKPAAIDPLDEEQIQTEMENDLRDQIAHNIHKGVLKQTAAGDVKYSWRGMIYLWCQFLVDLVRL